MAVDLNYTKKDYTSGDDGNFETTPAAHPKVERALNMAYRLIDGIGVGNRMHTDPAIARGGDTPTNRLLAADYCRQCLKPLVDMGQIRNLQVFTDDPRDQKGVGFQIKFFDVPAGRPDEVATAAPWGLL